MNELPLLTLLEQRPQWTEHELLLAVSQLPDWRWPWLRGGDQLSLFRCHFYLFNRLYQLRIQLRQQQRDLRITALDIGLQSLAYRTPALELWDPLAEYYLNNKHLEQANNASVAELLAAFWQQLHGYQQHQQALQVLELPTEASWPQIRQQYRRLCLQWHPDRGGQHQQLQALNQAYQQLRRYHQGHQRLH